MRSGQTRIDPLYLDRGGCGIHVDQHQRDGGRKQQDRQYRHWR